MLTIKSLLERIVDYNDIPKFQVERALAPFFSFYIEELVAFAYGGGPFSLIAPEFPLKKENRQSTNIDFLVSETTGQRVVLVELKTDFRASARQVLEHQEKYQKVVERVKADTAAFLRDDLNAIYDGSGTSHKDKYRRLRAMADRLSSEISDAEILYLVPHRVKEKIRDRELPYTKVLAFSEFPPALGADQDYADFRAALQRLN